MYKKPTPALQFQSIVLGTTHYQDGSPIATGLTEDQWRNTTSGAYSKNGNSVQEMNDYGYHYNWYALTDSRKICPAGSHLPTKEEWQELFDYLGGVSVAGVKMRSTSTTYWNTNPGSNSSGFNAYGAGFNDASGAYAFVKMMALFGSATPVDATHFYAPRISEFSDAIGEDPYLKNTAPSVRCIGD